MTNDKHIHDIKQLLVEIIAGSGLDKDAQRFGFGRHHKMGIVVLDSSKTE